MSKPVRKKILTVFVDGFAASNQARMSLTVTQLSHACNRFGGFSSRGLFSSQKFLEKKMLFVKPLSDRMNQYFSFLVMLFAF